MKVLLVDDHSLITDAVGALLTIWTRTSIHTAGHAPEAMKLVEAQPDADLLLLDWACPERPEPPCSRRSWRWSRTLDPGALGCRISAADEDLQTGAADSCPSRWRPTRWSRRSSS